MIMSLSHFHAQIYDAAADVAVVLVWNVHEGLKLQDQQKGDNNQRKTWSSVIIHKLHVGKGSGSPERSNTTSLYWFVLQKHGCRYMSVQNVRLWALFHQQNLRVGFRPESNVEPVLCVCTAEGPAPLISVFFYFIHHDVFIICYFKKSTTWE